MKKVILFVLRKISSSIWKMSDLSSCNGAICGCVASGHNTYVTRVPCRNLSRNLRERDNLTLSWCCGRLSAPWSRRPPSRSASASNPSIEDSASLNQAKNLSSDRSKLWSEFIAECSSFPRLMMLETDRSIQNYIRDLQFDSKQSFLTRDTIDTNRSPRANAPYLL